MAFHFKISFQQIPGLMLLAILLAAALPAQADPDCEFTSHVLEKRRTGATLTWFIQDSTELQEKLTLPLYSSWVRRRTQLGASEALSRFIKLASSSPESRSLYQAAIKNAELVSRAQIGLVRPLSCLEGFVFREFLKLRGLRQNQAEFSAVFFRMNGQIQVVADFDRSSNLNGFTESPAMKRAAARLRRDGWELWIHLHNHPYDFDNPYGDFGGHLVPSEPDILLYRDLKPLLAIITNGTETIEIPQHDFSKLHTGD